MPKVYFKAIPFCRDDVTLALESGVDGIITPESEVDTVSGLARCEILADTRVAAVTLTTHADEEQAIQAMSHAKMILLARGWDVIPVENLLAHEQVAGKGGVIALETVTVEEATLAAGILQHGVETVVVPPEGLGSLKAIVGRLKSECGDMQLSEAVITEITPVGMGHRVCVDTMSLLHKGQGMLVGNSAAFTFLVNAETEPNEFVAPRPFRINAGAVHAYAMMPADTTRYLEELKTGMDVLIVNHEGKTEIAVAGRLKVEVRPMLLIRATCGEEEGAVFLQNAETIRLVQPGGKATSVVELAPGDGILCRLDTAGRHFGIRIAEKIAEK